MLQVTVLEGDAETQAVIDLITKVYAAEGYVPQNTVAATALSSCIGEQHTTTFVAVAAETLLGTISLVYENPRGLPMEGVYKHELDTYRAHNAILAEVCRFAVDKQAVAAAGYGLVEQTVSLELLGAVLRFGLSQPITHYVFAVNPKHAPFYKMLGCEQIGEERSYESVAGAPAEAYVLDLEKIRYDLQHQTAPNLLLRKIFNAELRSSPVS